MDDESPMFTHNGLAAVTTDHDNNADETSWLIDSDGSAGGDRPVRYMCTLTQIVSWTSVFVIACVVAILVTKKRQEHYRTFPHDFVWGAATSAYQIEGAFDVDGRGLTIWDTFVHSPNSSSSNNHIVDNATGDVADDHYHKMKQDVQLMADLGLQAYRFSIAWSRILPNGSHEHNAAGIHFYNTLIDELVQHNITPFVTLYHWDLPQALQDEHGGWLSETTITSFCHYARICFQAFGDRVKHWITINEAWTVAVNGYATGVHAPGMVSATDPYLVGHALLLAHAHVARIYHAEFGQQRGRIGMANCGDFRYPTNATNRHDRAAAERAMLFQTGWFVDPLFLGDYPAVMRNRLGDRLPNFTKHERRLLLSSTDFLGLNYYMAKYAAQPSEPADYDGYWAHMNVDFSNDPIWRINDMGWPVVPDGLREMLLWMAARYDNPPIYITENGSAEDEPSLSMAKHDTHRLDFIASHLRASAKALDAGVNLMGYFAWSWMDNFEWQFGYTKRFGMIHVDFDTLQRTPKDSAYYYKKVMVTNRVGRTELKDESRPCEQGATFPSVTGDNCEPSYTHTRRLIELAGVHRRSSVVGRSNRLPSKVLIGYGSDCDKVRQAVYDGVNVVIWAFLDFERNNSPDNNQILDDGLPRLATKLDVSAIYTLINELKGEGHDVVHLVSVGGWNGNHLGVHLSAMEWYTAFRYHVGHIFDGIDLDLEGNDALQSPFNHFSKTCIESMIAMVEYAKSDGYIVTMAPPQSYLDVTGDGSFSRYVNLTDSSRVWPGDFSYFGANVYALVLAEVGPLIDLISLQFYESYSRAAEVVMYQNSSFGEYLVSYVRELKKKGEGYEVDFANDRSTELPKTFVSVPLSKLVVGLANGWALNSAKTLYVPANELTTAWTALSIAETLPRGAMFWTIDDEGENGISMARELANIVVGGNVTETA